MQGPSRPHLPAPLTLPRPHICKIHILRLSVCPRGHYCPAGSALPMECVAGTYQNDTGASICDICPDRYYCEFAADNVTICSTGSFCPEGTEFGTQFPCPNGTYSNQTGLASASECPLCPPGRCILSEYNAFCNTCVVVVWSYVGLLFIVPSFLFHASVRFVPRSSYRAYYVLYHAALVFLSVYPFWIHRTYCIRSV